MVEAIEWLTSSDQDLKKEIRPLRGFPFGSCGVGVSDLSTSMQGARMGGLSGELHGAIRWFLLVLPRECADMTYDDKVGLVGPCGR